MNDIINYKTANKLYSLLKNSNIPPIIIYGTKTSGKTELIKSVFQEIFPEKKYSTQTNESYDLSYHTHIHFFSCRKIKLKNNFFAYIEKITKSYNYYLDTKKYIIIDNFQVLDNRSQIHIKNILEKSYKTTSWIFITNDYNKLYTSLLSMCMIIRIPKQTLSEKVIYLKDHNNKQLYDQCKQYDINEVLLLSENCKYIYEEKTKELNLLVTNSLCLKDILSYSLSIKELDLSISKILAFWLSMISSTYSFDIISDIVSIISHYDHLYQKSYRDIIYIESIIIHIIDILHKKKS